MNNLITVSGVAGYIDENGVAQLKLEDCARGLGFTQIAASGNEAIRRERVSKYLDEFGFIPTSGDGGFIPESIFYRLAMKANNKTAVSFQCKIADEILPAIRKTGTYTVQPQDSYMIEDPIERAKAWIKEAEQKKLLETTIEQQRPKVIFAESLEVSKCTILIGELAKILRQNGVDIGQNRLFERLREDGYLMKRGEAYNQPTQSSMDLELFEIKKRTINNPDGSVRATTTTKVTAKGQIYFINKFKAELEQERKVG